jgi:hypothetical protein
MPGWHRPASPGKMPSAQVYLSQKEWIPDG